MSGKWVMFVDSDDAIAQNTLETCYENASTATLDAIQFLFTRNENDIGKTTEYSLRFYRRRIMHIRGK